MAGRAGRDPRKSAIPPGARDPPRSAELEAAGRAGNAKTFAGPAPRYGAASPIADQVEQLEQLAGIAERQNIRARRRSVEARRARFQLEPAWNRSGTFNPLIYMM